MVERELELMLDCRLIFKFIIKMIRVFKIYLKNGKIVKKKIRYIWFDKFGGKFMLSL